MPNTRHYICFIIISIAFADNQPIYKSVQLTPLNTNTNGASVVPYATEVITNTNDEWIATINSQNTWQFTVNLDENWPFDSQTNSMINFTVNSNSNVSDILFGFSINNDQFFSIWLPMNNDGRKNRIHPNCDTSNFPHSTLSSGDLSNLPNEDRICDIAPGNNEHGCLWATMKPKNAQTPNVFAYNEFPITFTLENNPNDNTFFVTYKSALFKSNFIQKCGFTSVTDSETLSMYIGGNQIGDIFSISSFDIEYEMQTIVSETTNAVSSDSISSELVMQSAGGAIVIDKISSKKASHASVKYMIVGMSILAVLMLMIISSIFFMYYHDVYGKDKYNMRNMEIIGGECEFSTSHDDSLSDLLDEESDEMPNETDFTDCIEEDIIADFNKNQVVNFMENGRMFDLIDH